MPAPCISPTDVENAVYQLLYRDSALYDLVGGRFDTGLDLKDVRAKMGSSATAALINVSYFEDEAEAKHGSAVHHMCTCRGLLQIDVAAMGGKVAATEIAVAVRALIYNDVSINIADVDYDISIGKVKILVSYNEAAACWIAAVRASTEYDTYGE